MKKKDTFKIGELSKLFDIGVDSIRYYEKVGILHPVRNDENNYRMYTIDDVRRLALIRELLGLSFSTDQIREYDEDRNVDSTTSLLRAELDVVDAEIAKLKATRDSIQNRLDTITSLCSPDIQDEFETIVIRSFQTESASWSLTTIFLIIMSPIMWSNTCRATTPRLTQ